MVARQRLRRARSHATRARSVGRSLWGGNLWHEPHGANYRRLPSINEAIEDLEAAISFGRTLPFVQQGPILLLGQSRGGFLSVIYAGRKPEDVLGVVNFVGGWMGGEEMEHLNPPYFIQAGTGAGARVPQLWLYAESDSFYSEAHVRANHAAFQAAGGLAKFEYYRGIPTDG